VKQFEILGEKKGTKQGVDESDTGNRIICSLKKGRLHGDLEDERGERERGCGFHGDSLS